MVENKKKLHIILDAELKGNVILNIYSEEIKEFPNEKAAFEYVNKQEGRYEQLSTREMLLSNSKTFKDIYVMQSGF